MEILSELFANPAEVFRESGPFVVGLVIAPIVFWLMSRAWPSNSRWANLLKEVVISILIGALVSLLVGELAMGWGEAFVAVIIDSTIVFIVAKAATWLFWQPVVFKRIFRQAPTSEPRTIPE